MVHCFMFCEMKSVMTKIIYFVTPKTLAKIASKIGTKGVEFLPIVGPAVEFTKKAQKVKDLANPVSARSRGLGLAFGFCFRKTAAVSLD